MSDPGLTRNVASLVADIPERREEWIVDIVAGTAAKTCASGVGGAAPLHVADVGASDHARRCGAVTEHRACVVELAQRQ